MNSVKTNIQKLLSVQHYMLVNWLCSYEPTGKWYWHVLMWQTASLIDASRLSASAGKKVCNQDEHPSISPAVWLAAI